MKKGIIFLVAILSFSGCTRCTEELLLGEMVEIEIEFIGFSVQEINSMKVYRVDKTATSIVDTFSIKEILFSREAISNRERITDQAPPSQSQKFGDYESYFDNAHLVFEWLNGKDTLSDFVVRKSKGNGGKCHEDDPNVRIDELAFTHKGARIGKNQQIQINK